MKGLIPWRERGEVDRFRGEIDKLFNDFFNRRPFRSFEKGDWMPLVDVSENEKEVVVHADMPGIDAEDIDISINGRILTIKGERHQEQEDKDKNYHQFERRYGSFQRSFELPADVDSDKVKAISKNGILTIHFHKAKEQSVKKIEVKSS
jgi:HSP20 family protein